MDWYKAKYSVTFPMYASIKGSEKDPTGLAHFLTDGEEIKEDWTKFLISQKGEFLVEYGPDDSPWDIEGIIDKLYKESKIDLNLEVKEDEVEEDNKETPD